MKYLFSLITALLSFLPIYAAYGLPSLDSNKVVSPKPKLNSLDASAKLEKLLSEARTLFRKQKLIDGRSKLIKALEVAPEDYRPHMLLGTYYLGEVRHFELASRYINKAVSLFEMRYGSELDGSLDTSVWQEHAHLLYLLSESELNLDNYTAALRILDRFGSRYWDDWYPGTRSWVLMKLKRIDEAIRISQAGLLRGAEPGRTYNILGILLSLKENRKLSLEAFARAIKAESLLGALGQPATPLNNAGEVYRELFSDDLAEASWIKALSMSDGCEHILPSLNLAILYIDELRILQAERVLNDFQACFGANTLQSDTEHRALLALARGRIALHKGDIDEAISHFERALEKRQWFGKIGTNENDLRFAATISMAKGLEAKASTIEDRVSRNITDRLHALLEIPWLKLSAWWYYKRAREIALDELSNFEDLSIRHTDTMLEYPTLGSATKGFPVRGFQTRINRLLKSDSRPAARLYYETFLATNLLEHGKITLAIERLNQVRPKIRKIDRLLRAEVLAQLIIANEHLGNSFWRTKTKNETERNGKDKEELFSLHPSHFRQYGFTLPVSVKTKSTTSAGAQLVQQIKEELLSERFEQYTQSNQIETQYELAIVESSSDASTSSVSIALRDKSNGRMINNSTKSIEHDKDLDLEKLLNGFIDSTFAHKTDPPPTALPELGLLK